MTLNCFKCHAEVVFDSEHIGKNGRKIPLDPLTKTPHDCPMREKKFTAGESNQPERIDVEAKDDHGNEGEWAKAEKEGRVVDYLDHTLKPELKLKILVDPTAEGLAEKYNSFEKPIKFSQYQLAPSLYTIAIYYEDNGK